MKIYLASSCTNGNMSVKEMKLCENLNDAIQYVANISKKPLAKMPQIRIYEFEGFTLSRHLTREEVLDAARKLGIP